MYVNVFGIPLAAVVAGDIPRCMTKTGEKLKHFTNLRQHHQLNTASKCGAITDVRGSVLVFNITQTDVNSIPFGPWRDGFDPWAQQRPLPVKNAPTIEKPDLRIRTCALRPFFFIQFIFTAAFVIFMSFMELHGA